jgi:predicted lipopolysaccharide heptosyltransferase III
MKILLVRLRLIGDVIFTTPLLRALRRAHPTAHLSYVVEPAAAPILHANPNIDQLIVIPKRSGLQRLADDARIGLRLRRERFDVAIDLHGGPRSSWLTWASGAPTRIGYDIPGRSWMYTHPVARAKTLPPRNSVLNQWDLLAPLGIATGNATQDPVEMPDDPSAEARVANRLREAGIGPANPLVVVHVSSNNPFRCWPADSFESLVVALAREDPARRIFVTSGPSDPEGAGRIVDAARRQLGAHASSLAELGFFELPELRALIARAAVYIGGDSGPLHVAATTGVPIVELLGPTLAERSRPWRHPRWFTEIVESGPLPCRPCNQRVCTPGDFRCLRDIGPNQVLAAAARALGSTARASNEDRVVHS